MAKLESFFNKILHYRFYIIALFAIVIMFGIYSILHIKIDAIPDITNKQVIINSKTSSMDPLRAEKVVTYPIESEMYGIEGLEEIRSLTKFGLSQVVLIFKDDVDIYFARQQVLQRLINLKDVLPMGISPNIAPLTTGIGEIIIYRIYYAKDEKNSGVDYRNLSELRTAQQFILARELKRIKGVAEVDTIGGYARELHLNIKPEVLKANGMNLAKLEQQLTTLGENYGGGYIEKDDKQMIVRTNPNIKNYEDIINIPLKVSGSGSDILIRQVVEMRQDYSQRLGAATSGDKEAVLGTVMLRAGDNAKEVLNDVEKAIANLNQQNDKVKIEVLYNRNFLISTTITTVLKNLLEGVALVIIVLCVIVGGVRIGLIVAMSLPICAFILAIAMKLFGISANLMSLGAIDFGLLVDPSVVVIEYLVAHLAFNSREEKLRNISQLLSKMVRPLFFGMLIIILVYVPILMFHGIEGKTFKPMAIAVIISLIASIVTAFILMPVLAYFLLNNQHHHQSKIMEKINAIYCKILRLLEINRYKTILFSFLFFIFSIVVFVKMPSDFLPNLNEGDNIITIAMQDGTSLSKTVEIAKEASAIISKDPRISKVFARIGSGESGLDPAPQNVADIFIIIKDQYKGNASAISASNFKTLKGICSNCDISETQPIKMRFNEMLQGSRADLSLKVFGQDLKTLLDTSKKIKDLLAKDPQIKTIEQDLLNSIKIGNNINITPDYHKITRNQVAIANINRNVVDAMSGINIGNFYASEFPIAIILHMNEKNRNQLDSIAKIPISLADGGSIALKEVAEIKEEEGIISIPRLFGKRYAAISIYLNDTDYYNFIKNAEKTIKEAKALPSGYYIEWGGKFNNMQQAKKQIMLILPIIFLIIIFILFKIFHDFRKIAVVVSSLPFAISGGILLLAIVGLPITISAYIGFIVLAGISLLNSIILVDSVKDVATIEQACVSRLRPILMTALVATLGFLPMALAREGAIGAEVQQPIAVTVIGGIVSATIATLFLNPLLLKIVLPVCRRRQKSIE